MIKYEEIKQFKRDFKRLHKKYPSLRDDLRILKRSSIEMLHFYQIENQGIVEIQNAGNTDELRFFKVKKFACKSLKGKGARSGLRLIYAYFPVEQKIIFIEIYFKSKKPNEDRNRILEFKEEFRF